MTGEVAQVVEHLGTKHKAQDSNPNTAPKKQQQKVVCLGWECRLPSIHETLDLISQRQKKKKKKKTCMMVVVIISQFMKCLLGTEHTENYIFTTVL
jgi:hypothetical protein